MRQYSAILCFLFCLLLSAGGNCLLAQGPEIAGTEPKVQSPASHIENSNKTQQDLVHFGDVIDVDVLGGFEFDWRGTLNPEGFLDGFESYGEPVYGLCRSEEQIAADVAKVYARILRVPRVEVKIIDRSNRAVARLEGAVRTPSRFRLRRKAGLRELLVLAGGLTDAASGEITIFRPKNLSCAPAPVSLSATGDKETHPQDNGSQTLSIKISDLLKGNVDASPEILSGDMITVTPASPIYIIGAVNNPRPIYTASQITLKRAIAMAGGLAKGADGGRVTIFRRVGLESTVINLDLDKNRIAQLGDEILKPFDIIDVAAKGALERKYLPAAAYGNSTERVKTELPLKVVD